MPYNKQQKIKLLVLYDRPRCQCVLVSKSKGRRHTQVDIYSDALKCDILQAVHHGFRGGTVAMYRICRPKVVLFCCCNEGEYGIGNFINNDYNQALVDPAQNPEFEEYFVAGTDVTYLSLPYRAGTSIVLELGL